MPKPDYYIGSAIDVRRHGVTVRIPPGQMVSETDLTPTEIASLTPHGVLRRPTQEEWEKVLARQAGEAPALAAAPVDHTPPWNLPGKASGEGLDKAGRVKEKD